MDFLANPYLFDTLLKLFSYLAIVSIVPFLFIIYLVLTENIHRQQVLNTALNKINHYLRMLWYMLSLFMFPYAFIAWFAGIVAKNFIPYNLNLILIGLYFPVVMITCFLSRWAEIRNKEFIPVLLLFIPFLIVVSSIVLLLKI